MPADANTPNQAANNVVPLFGRDEMNIVEFPIGPITAGSSKTFEVDHVVWDKKHKREIVRRLTITGSDAFGLPRPIDDQILIGMKALTQEAGFKSRKVWFSQYHFCRTIGWRPDGRSYERLEKGFDRLAGSTLKYKDAWWDKGEGLWRSHTFHLLDNVELCNSERYGNAVRQSGRKRQALCYFVWNDVIWKSFQDGYIKSLDMNMFRKIARGRRREVPLRLYRWLDKQFWKRPVVEIDVWKLAIGTLGIAGKYSSELKRTIARAASVLVDAGFLRDVRFTSYGNSVKVVFSKAISRKGIKRRRERACEVHAGFADDFDHWVNQQRESDLLAAEEAALASNFGTKFEREMVRSQQKQNRSLKQSGRLRLEYIRKFLEPSWAAKWVEASRTAVARRKTG